MDDIEGLGLPDTSVILTCFDCACVMLAEGVIRKGLTMPPPFFDKGE